MIGRELGHRQAVQRGSSSIRPLRNMAMRQRGGGTGDAGMPPSEWVRGHQRQRRRDVLTDVQGV